MEEERGCVYRQFAPHAQLEILLKITVWRSGLLAILPGMLMVVFGAGASYDCAPSLRGKQPNEAPSRPPLAKDLFQNRAPFALKSFVYRRMLKIVPLLRETHGKPIEEVLETLQIEAETYPEGKRQLAAVRYYLRDVLGDCTINWVQEALGVTNYRSLLDQIARQRHERAEPITLVTFNYDALLEDALADEGFQLEKISDYISHPTYKLFKLHGSVDWSRVVQQPYATTLSRFDLIDLADELKFVPDRFVLNRERQDFKGTLLLFPAIAIPVQRKDIFECPAEHVEALSNLIPKVTQILFIGWQAQEDNFLKMLREGLRPLKGIMVVDENSEKAKAIAAHLQNSLGPVESYCADEGFSQFIETREGDKFFRL
jgi:hypothetical protein